MSWMAAGWVKHCRLGNANRKAVMLVIADYSTEDGSAVGVTVPEGNAVCWAGIAEIARNAEVGESTCRRILVDMETAGVIRRQKRGRAWGVGGRTTDLIFLDYARPFMQVSAANTFRPDRALTPVDDAVEDAPQVDQPGEGYRSIQEGLALDPEGVSARLVNAQNLQKNHQPTDNNVPVDNSTHDRATHDRGNGSSSVEGRAPPAHARPPPSAA